MVDGCCNITLKLIAAVVIKQCVTEEVVLALTECLLREPHQHARCMAVSQGSELEGDGASSESVYDGSDSKDHQEQRGVMALVLCLESKNGMENKNGNIDRDPAETDEEKCGYLHGLVVLFLHSPYPAKLANLHVQTRWSWRLECKFQNSTQHRK